ncbi:MAG: hypothetical protein MUC96_05385 [Myxococcaceae bacterium]|jgi:hypothetical protein|nr:hypothetical protein [Myxococcaceae bacterium]
MGKLLSLVLGLAVIAGAVYWTLLRPSAPVAEGAGPSAPKQTLDNVRGAATRIEEDAQQRADEVERKALGGE